VLQVTADAGTARAFARDLDHLIEPAQQETEHVGAQLLKLVCDAASDAYRPRLWAAGCTDFQLTRGLLGVSL
jgi:hypothetical protein